jgi:hypothetical protein
MISQSVLIIFILRTLAVDRGHIKEMTWWIAKPGLFAILETFFTFSWGGPRFGLDDFWIAPAWPWLMLLLSLIYAVALFCGCKKGGGSKAEFSLILYWLTVPVALLFVLSHMGKASFFAGFLHAFSKWACWSKAQTVSYRTDPDFLSELSSVINNVQRRFCN